MDTVVVIADTATAGVAVGEDRRLSPFRELE